MNIIFSIFIFVIGGIFGSFSNMLIYRLPRKISILFPSSFCPRCGKKIKFYDNIPIISFIILRGKCRNCGEKIPLRYFIVELLMAFIFLFSYLKFNISLNFFKVIVFAFFAINISFIDIEKMLIPDALSFPGALSGILFIFFSKKVAYFLVGGLVGAIIPTVIWGIGKLMKKELMGEGDILILSMIGFYTGWINVIIILFIASFLGTVVGIPLKIKRKTNYLPFAPFLFLSALFILFHDLSTFLPYLLFKSNLK